MIRKCEAVIKDLKAVPGLVEAYEKKADQMERALKKSREKFVSEEDLKESSRGPLTKEIRSYETYISQDGERRNMIRGLTEKSRENIRFMEQLIEEAEEVIQYIDDWEPSDEEDDLDEERWDDISEKRFALIKDTKSGKCLCTLLKEALEAGDYDTASDLQIEISKKGEALEKEYYEYALNIVG